MNSLAGPWLKTSVVMLVEKQMSSTISPMVRQADRSTPLSGLAVARTNLHSRPQQLRVPLMNAKRLPFQRTRRRRLAVEFAQLGLVVEQLELARPAGHEQERSPPWPGRGMRLPRRQRVRRLRGARRFAGKQCRDRHRTETHPAPPKEVAARHSEQRDQRQSWLVVIHA